MGLSNDLIAQFVKVTNDASKPKKETTVYGTYKGEKDGVKYVQLDGASEGALTPVSTTVDANDGDRVIVTIKNHSAYVTGNLSSPAPRGDTISDKITEFERVVADKVSTEQLEVERGRIDDLETDNILVKEELLANKATVDQLVADDADVRGRLTATEADIDNLETNKLDAAVAEVTYATVENLDALSVDVYDLDVAYGEFKEATTERLDAIDATIEDLDVENLNARYANIDFSNIDEAAIDTFYSKSGIINKVTISEGVVVKQLVGVTISGDLIEGNTVKAEKLVVKGSDGLYYKLNTDGMTVEKDQTEYNSLNGEVIKARSITATKISVDDLVAFGARIGGFEITENALYSGVKESVDNTTQGVYLDSTGQIAIGDSNNFLKYYKASDGTYKLEISANSFVLSASNKTVEQELSAIRDEMTTNLRIESSRGTVFKNDNISTVLSAVIYRGSQRITDLTTLRSAMGNGAYLQWKWQRIDEDSFGVISSSDTRLGNDGFTFTLSPNDVDTKVTFLCELIT